MKCPLCESLGKEVDISDARVRNLHAKNDHQGVTGADLEMLAQPYPSRTTANSTANKNERGRTEGARPH